MVSQGRVWVNCSKNMSHLRLLSSLVVPSPSTHESGSLCPCASSCSFSSPLKMQCSHNKYCESEHEPHTRPVWTLISQLHGVMGEYEQRCKHTALHFGLWGLENVGSQHAAMQRYHRHQDNISPQGPKKKKVFMWFPFHKGRLHCLDNIPWQLEFTTRLAQGSALPALEDQRQGLSVHFHTSLKDWSLTIRKSMIENACLDLENTLPELIGVVTRKIKMQETLQLLTWQSGWYRIKDSRLSAVAHRHQLHWLKCPSLL